MNGMFAETMQFETEWERETVVTHEARRQFAVRMEALRVVRAGAIPEWLKFDKGYVSGTGIWIDYAEDVKEWLRENGSKRLR